jgi:hypothetical protein
MHGALRDASVLPRMAMRATSRNEQVASRGLTGLPALGGALGFCRPVADLNQARVA